MLSTVKHVIYQGSTLFSESNHFQMNDASAEFNRWFKANLVSILQKQTP
jgi:hypothetical protein